jgi:transposase
MFFPEGQIRVHLYGKPCDMRKSFPGLHALTRQELQAALLNGDLYVFISRRATQMKVLYFDRSGFCIWSKKLEAGRFIGDWGQVRTRQMEWTGLKLLLEGIEPGKLRKRYRLPKTINKADSNTATSLQYGGDRPLSAPSSEPD